MGKFYAVKKGKTTGLFTDWASCQEAIKGYSGAEYKSFTDEKQALLYLMGEKIKEKPKKKSEIKKLTQKEQCNVFASGFYEIGQSKCNIAIIIKDTTETKTYFCCVIDEFCDKQKTIAAELLSAYIGLQIAIDLGYTEINLYSNYSGIQLWATKEWIPKTNVASSFVRYIDKHKKDYNINVYQLQDVDKEDKKTLKYYVGYASSTHYLITVQQILDENILEESVDTFNE